MTNEKIVMLKLYNGDFIIGAIENVDDSSNAVHLNDPRLFSLMPSMSGGISVSLSPICSPFNVIRLKRGCDIAKKQIMFMLDEDEIDNELVNGYRSEVSGIKIASSAETASIISGQDNTKPREFII